MSKNAPYHLIHKDIVGDISVDESRQLQNWLDRDSKNEVEFDAIIDVWNESSSYNPNVQFDANLAFLKTKSKVESDLRTSLTTDQSQIQSNSKQPSNLNRSTQNSDNKVIGLTTWYKYAIAASIALLICAFIGYNTLSQDEEAVYAAISGKIEKIELADGSIISLYPGAEVTLLDKFNKSNRKVKHSGKVFYKVAKSKNLAFEVLTDYGNVAVLGTQFLVDASSHEEDDISVFVEEGSVKFTNTKDESVILTSNQSVKANATSVLDTSKISTALASAFEDGVLRYDNVALSLVFDDLARFYGVQIVYDEAFDTIEWSTTGFNLSQNNVADFLTAVEKGLADRMNIVVVSSDADSYTIRVEQ